VYGACHILGSFPRAGLGLAALAILLTPPSLALDGAVSDAEGHPIEGCRVCYTSARVELLCVETGTDGRWVLPDSELDRIRVSADGYLPQELAAEPRRAPIKLEKAATLLVRLVDARTGEGLDKGVGEVVYPSGRQRRFMTNRAGSRVKTLDPLTVTVTARVEGYAPGGPEIVELKGGEEIELELRLEPLPAEADAPEVTD
jgi:hypothetical protein